MSQPAHIHPRRPRRVAHRTGRVAARITSAIVALTALTVGVAAPPWALIRFIGRPLPDRLPTLEQVWTALSVPPSASVVIDVLACVCWVAWAAFVLDVVLGIGAATLNTAAWVHGRSPILLRAAGWRPGATLVGIVLVALLAGSRPTPATGPVPTPAPITLTHTTEQAPAQGWVTVRAPVRGVHDSLWRIADRELGDPQRWHEVYEHNAGVRQDDGRALTRPDLIQPGWRLEVPAGPAGNSAPPPSPRPPTALIPPPPSPAPPSPASPSAADAGSHDGRAGTCGEERTGADGPSNADKSVWVEVGPGVAVTVGFAAAVAAALALARRRNARATGAPSVDDEQFPVFPVVREIARRAPAPQTPPDRDASSKDLTDTTTDNAATDGRTLDAQVTAGPAELVPQAADQIDSVPGSACISPVWDPLLSAAQAEFGLGLAGQGALPVMRALVLEFLLTPSPGHARRILIADDLRELLGLASSILAPLGVVVEHRANTALDVGPDAEASGGAGVQVVRFGAGPEEESDSQTHGADVLSIRYGPCLDGVTVYLRANGTIAAAGPAAHARLVGLRLPVLDVYTAAELLELRLRCCEAREDDQLSPLATSDIDTSTGYGGDDQDQEEDGDRSVNEPAAASSTVAPNDQATNAGGAVSASASDADDHDVGAPAETVPWLLSVFGPPMLFTRMLDADGQLGMRDVTGALTPRLRDLLVFLAAHPHGVRRDAAVAALWPDTGRDRPTNNLSSLISRLRSTLRTVSPPDVDSPEVDDGPAGRMVVAEGELYRLDPDHVLVDYWTFLAATSSATASTAAHTGQPAGELDTVQLADLHRAHDLYRGALAEGVDDDWILSTREAARRAYLATTARLVRHYVAAEPAAALGILETARNLEPTTEPLYRDIIALQLRLGDNDGASVTRRLLQSQLADIDEEPEPATLALIRNSKGVHSSAMGIP